MGSSLVSTICEQANRNSEQLALVIPSEPVLHDRSITYGGLYKQATQISYLIHYNVCSGGSLGILGIKSPLVYTGVLAGILSRTQLVPLHPRFPAQRTLSMYLQGLVSTLLVDRLSYPALRNLLQILPDEQRPNHIILQKGEHQAALEIQRLCQNTRISVLHDDLECRAPDQDRDDDPAYVLFTSGSTGKPKGVPVNRRNVSDYVHFIKQNYPIGPGDRCSQTFDLTFDLSFHDILVTWSSGATLYSLSPGDLLFPAAFINRHQMTHWFSVPSLPMLMAKMGMLAPNAFPSLKVSLFCGEALPTGIARLWQAAAPNSSLDNLYGPTEATIAITSYRWAGTESQANVPIGRPFQGQQAVVFDPETLTPITEAEKLGELWLEGSQVTNGYLNNQDATKKAFVGYEGKRWYRTGDLAKTDASGNLHYAGRIDHQVKVQGFRVELAELEGVIQRHYPTSYAVALPWPPGKDSAESLCLCFLGHLPESEENIARLCRTNLPEYMVPGKILAVESIPTNANGKIDRSALARSLEQG